MKRPQLFWLAALLLAICLAGCESDPGGEPSPDFQGEWVLVTTLAQKLPCDVNEVDEISVEAVSIAQEGSLARLDFNDFSVTGEIVDGVLYAAGNASSGRALHLELTRKAQSLDGNVRLLGDGCQEERSVVARRRQPDADFSGHWEFELTVVGEGGCAHIPDYDDCFRILQTGDELLVVDDVGGNLSGRVFGDVAQIRRQTSEESTSLVFYMDLTGSRVSGTAMRAFGQLACRTDLVFVGVPTSLPCAQHGG